MISTSTRVFINSRKLGALLFFTSLITLALMEFIREDLSVVVGTIIIPAIFLVERKFKYNLFNGLYFASFLIWCSSFLFYALKSSNWVSGIYLILAMSPLLASSVFGLYKIFTVDARVGEVR